MLQITLDIETLPDQSPNALETIEVTVPGNYKNPEVIEKYIADNRSEKWLSTALNGLSGELCSAAWAIGSADPSCVVREQDQPEATFLETVFRLIYGDISTASINRPQQNLWIGHNIPWDLRFLKHRAWILNIRPPFDLPADARHGQGVFDNMQEWAGFRGMIAQEKLAKALGIPGKAGGISGSDVFPLWKAGEYEKIRAYNISDVVTARAIYRRLTWQT